jgi:hypothetical protein
MVSFCICHSHDASKGPAVPCTITATLARGNGRAKALQDRVTTYHLSAKDLSPVRLETTEVVVTATAHFSMMHIETRRLRYAPWNRESQHPMPCSRAQWNLASSLLRLRYADFRNLSHRCTPQARAVTRIPTRTTIFS